MDTVTECQQQNEKNPNYISNKALISTLYSTTVKKISMVQQQQQQKTT